MIDLTIKIGGEAGHGINSTGQILAKTLAAAGYYVFGYPEYPSLVRGGHNTFLLRVSEKPIYCQKQSVDVLLALDSKTVAADAPFLSERGVLIYDDEESAPVSLPRPRKAIGVPLAKLTKEIGGDEIMRNTVGLGSIFAVFDLPVSFLEAEISKEFADKDPRVPGRNLRAMLAGYRFTRQTMFKYAHLLPTLPPEHSKGLKISVLSGNEALAKAALASGMTFSAIYPMTPIQSLLTILKALEKESNLQIIQPADEIEGINMAIGAAYVGKSAMVATSGGGFCLMTEALGLSAQAEIPLVIILGSRPGPATGLPTGTEQGDLRFALHAGHGDFPRLVLAPGNLQEIITATQQAFKLANKYGVPAIVLVDKFLCESLSAITLEQLQSLESPISQHQGKTELITKTSGEEHDKDGFICEEAENRKQMMEQRMGKLESVAKEITGFSEYPLRGAKTLVISWGSPKEAVLEAVHILGERGNKINCLFLNSFSPFPGEAISLILKNYKNIIIIENNYSGQAASVIREKTGFEILNKLLKYDGRPFEIEEIVEYISSKM
ncbi:MAG: 2-oxoacid:acceptor oxidoreductase subunit alpha [Patescibacteria group bacterium]